MRVAAKSLASLVVFGSLTAASPPARSAAYKYTTISNSQSPSDSITPLGINGNDVVVGYDIPNGKHKSIGFVWRGGNFTASSNVTFFSGINNNGIAAGAAGNAKTGADVVLYNVTNDTYQTTALGLHGEINNLKLNLAGLIAGDALNHKFTKYKPFLFNNGTPTRIRTGEQKNCDARDLNDSGDVIGVCGYYISAYLYSNGNYAPFAVPNATTISLDFITNGGVIGGGARIGSAYVSFSYFGGVYTYYTPTLSNYGQGGNLVGALPNGNFVGGYADTAGFAHGYLYNTAENAYYQLDYPGAVYTDVRGVSSAGSLIGVYQATVNGPYLAFIATCSAKQGCNQ